MTRSSVILGLLGVLLIVAAALVRFVYLPSASRLPDDFDSTQSYAGTYSGVNPDAFAGGPVDQVLVRDVPAEISRRYATASVDGDTAVVTRTLQTPAGEEVVGAAAVRYAVDRTTLESVPSDAKDVVASKGLIFSLPLHPQTDAKYQLWDEATAKAFPLTYKGTGTVQGREVYRFESTAEGPVADPAALGLPTSITRGQLTDLGPRLASLLPPAVQAQLPALLAALPSDIPLTWTSKTTSTVWADQTVGAPIRANSSQEISASIVGISLPFATMDLTSTQASDTAIASDASDIAAKLTWIGTIIPIAALVLGVLLLALAVFLAIRAGRRPGGPTPAEPPGVSEPVPA
nr:porin PorA family protein [Petropleomorpha daqingensis]